MTDVPDVHAMADLCTPWSVHVACTLRVAEHLDGGPLPIGDLAGRAGADPDALSRVLRHLASRGVFAEPEPGHFAINEAARQLLDPAMALGLGLDGVGGRMAHAWGSLLTAVRTGRPAFADVFGSPFWDDLQAHQAIGESFDDLMGPAGHGAADPDVLPGGDWTGVRTVVDVGGGTGALLAAILQAHPDVTGTLVDLPGTAARAVTAFADAGLADRVTVRPQSFFDPLPPGADVYVLKSILTDWPEADAEAILRRCADAARPSGRILLVGAASPGRVDTASDLLMFVLVGGRERTADELNALVAAAGLRVTATGRQRSGRLLTECRPA